MHVSKLAYCLDRLKFTENQLQLNSLANEALQSMVTFYNRPYNAAPPKEFEGHAEHSSG